MAYAVSPFDWMTRAWSAEITQALGDGTIADYLETEQENDPEADPAVTAAEAYQIATAEFANLVTSFMRDCHEALEGVRAFRIRTTAGGGTALTFGSILSGDLLYRSGTGVIGIGLVDVMLTQIERRDGNPSMNATIVEIDQTTGLDLIDVGAAGTTARIANVPGTSQDVGVANDDGDLANGVAAADHVHALTIAILRDASVYEDTAWSAQATNAFSDGTEVINGINHTVVQSSLAGASWGIVNGQGFVWTIPNNLARSWTLGSLTTAPYFYRALSTVPGIDMMAPLIIDMHLTGQVYENGNDAVRVGLWELAATPYAASSARARIIDRGNFGGTSTIRTFDGTTVATSPETFAPDCIRTIIRPRGEMSNFYGTWAGGWPSTWNTANRLDTAHNVLNSFSSSARIVFVFINSADSSPTTTATIADVRYSRG